MRRSRNSLRRPQTQIDRESSVLEVSIPRQEIVKHMQTQHVDDYPGFLKMSASEKTAFWASVTNGIIGELIFKKEDELTATDQEEDDDVDDAVVQAEMLAANSKRQAMDVFVEQEDGSYVATIKTPMKFELSIGYISDGMSFRQTAEAVGMTIVG
ncbi:hypothetical protein DYB30_012927 [Aphanomyces astaci]|uniref:Uncharacterized protein n=1 Tax=Aphanomyces astaci TaxID=112090 RepID=A0A397EW89_APHAT|nr:hypothetical protein DYB38_006891 [Aphanomyces astaci]RHY38578.1 hypothetical protein DYB30_012927 [Aphanomyces astaci]RHY53126.1 hypothetical protein DYB34_006041 [Aphanomyces astaci]RHZ06938.1 hypothetical protein DYB31_007647 [Aphanomyces astaci]